MAEQGITLAQMEALLTPLKEAVEANTARLTSMESKLEAHDASFEDVKWRLGVLETASPSPEVDEEIKSAVATEVKILEAVVLEAVENKTADSYEDKMTKMVADNEEHTTYMINEFLKHATAMQKGNRSSENRSLVDFDQEARSAHWK